VLAGRDIVLLSDGSATRTFCYVMDAVDGYYRILTRPSDGEPYNIGAISPRSPMRELAERVTRIAGGAVGYRGQVVAGRPTTPTTSPTTRTVAAP
jgi:UDP-glucuronate decarboxylase